MTEEVLALFTSKSVEAILEVGGTQSWKLDRGHAKRCCYAILCRNAYTDWGDGKEPHGTAFMIGRIADVVPTAENDGRWLVTFDQYARIDLPNVWKGWRNPVRYTTLEELGVSLEGIQFQPMPPIDADAKATHDTFSHPENGHEFRLTTSEAKLGLAKTFGVSPDANEFRLTISEAKLGLAKTFGVSPDAIEITIRG